MAQQKEIVVTLRLEDRGAVERLGQLEIETKQYQRELRALNAEIAKNGEATRQQTLRVGELQASIRRNQTVVRELKNDLSGATDAGLRFRDKMAEASRAGLGAFGLQAVSIAAITTAVIQAVKELGALAVQIEKIDARNAAIAGNSLPALTKAAEDNANAIGLTRREYVSLAADQQLRLKNLGIEGELTERLAIQTVEQAEALSDFSAGQLSTEQAAKLLNDALTGQTRGLKELGINVKASKEEVDAIAQALIVNEGLTIEQAQAVATLQLAFEATEATMAVFKGQTLEIDAAQDSANARLKEAKEALAEGLIPAVVAATQAQAGYIESFAGFADSGAFRKFLAVITVGMTEVGRASVAGIGSIGEEVKKAEPAVADLAKAIETLPDAAGAFEVVAQRTRKLSEVREELKKAKEAREDLLTTDRKGLAESAAQIAALEKEIAAVDLKTQKVQGLTAAQIEAARVAKEAAAGRAEPVPERLEAIDTTLEASPLSFTPEGVTEAEIAAQQYLQITEELRILEIQGIVDFNAQLLQLEAEKNAGKLVSEEEYQARKAAIQQQAEQQEFENQQRMVAAAGDFFGALSSLAAEGSAEFKALATTQALINTYLGATQALSNPLVLNPFVKIAQAAAIILNGLSAVSRIQGFAEGGFTQPGQKHQVAGIVHASEYVVPKSIVEDPDYAPLLSALENRRLRGYAGGGAVAGSVRFTRGTGIAPRPSPGELIATERLAEARATNFAPVVSVVEINKVQNRTRVIENLSSA